MLTGSGEPEEDEQALWLEQVMAKAGERRIAWFLHRPLFLEDPGEGDTGYWSVKPQPRGPLLGAGAAAPGCPRRQRTSALRLAEHGAVDLHTDVNRYLRGMQVAAGWERPVTLHDLLTHTAGFEESIVGYAARTPADVRPLGDFLAEKLPRRGWAPGDVTATQTMATRSPGTWWSRSRMSRSPIMYATACFSRSG